MSIPFGEALRRLRIKQGLSQRQLADKMNVERPSIANWESGRRTPNIDTIFALAENLGVDASTLISAANADEDDINVIVVDDESIALNGALNVLRDAIPSANVTGFTKPLDALDYIKDNHVALAFLDIELGHTSGLTLCGDILKISPRTNVVFLTAFKNYSFDAWETGACGFLLKPLEADEVHGQLTQLRYPVGGLL